MGCMKKSMGSRSQAELHQGHVVRVAMTQSIGPKLVAGLVALETAGELSRDLFTGTEKRGRSLLTKNEARTQLLELKHVVTMCLTTKLAY